MNKKNLLITLLLLNIKFTFATVLASVDHNDLNLGQSLNLTITLPDSSAEPALDILKSSFDIYGTSKSSQTSIVNGHVSSQTTVTVSLLPKTAGKQAIPPIKVGNDSTQAIPINVSATQQTTPEENKNGNNKKQAVYLDTTISDKNAYLNVPIIYSVKLYYLGALDNLQLAPIDIPGAKVEPMGKTIQYQSRQSQQNYQVVEQKFLITPTKTGSITLPPAVIQGISLDNNRNDNDIFAMMGSHPFKVLSKPATLNVKPIPQELDASTWLPAKNLQLTESWAMGSSKLIVGEPITRTITISATGIPATSIPNLDFAIPDEVSDYPEKPQAETNINNDQLVATKSFKIVYIPNKAGDFSFPEINVKWWDITSNSLKIATIQKKNLHIANDPNNNSQQIKAPATLQSLQASAPIKKPVNQNTPSKNNLWVLATLLFALLWLVTILCAFYLYKKNKIKKNTSDKTPVPESQQKNNKLPSMLEINLACQNKNIHTLNLAILNWATEVFGKKIHSLNELQNLSQQPQLNNLLEQLNIALYKNIEFTNFDELLRLLSQFKIITQNKSDTTKLKSFYPE